MAAWQACPRNYINVLTLVSGLAAVVFFPERGSPSRWAAWGAQ